ncbi:MAG: tetratricopeptide repeat protein [Bacteroidota bacterium]
MNLLIITLLFFQVKSVEKNYQEFSFLKNLSPEKQIQKIIDTSDYLNNKDPRKALRIINKGFELLKQYPNVKQERDLYYTKSWAYMELSELKEADKFAQMSYSLNTDTSDYIYLSQYYNLMSSLEISRSQFVKGFDYLYKGLKAAEMSGNKKRIAVLSGNLGNAYSSIGRYDDALNFYQTSLKLCNEINDKPNIAIWYDNIGLVYTAKKQYKEALSYYWKANKLYREVNNTINYYWNFAYLGDTYLNLGNYSEAEKYLNFGLEGSKKYNHLLGIVENSVNLGKLYYAQKKYDEALKILKEIGPKVIKINNLTFLTSIYQILSEIYSVKGNYKYAYNYSLKFQQYADSILAGDIEKKATDIEVRYSMQKKENELAMLKKNKLLDELNLRKAHDTRNYLIVIFVLATTFFVVFLFMKSKSFKKLEKKQEVINSQKEKLEEINNELVRSQTELQHLNIDLEAKVFDEVKKREAQQMLLMQKSKLESLGIFSAGIAHEINQPLTSISFSVENMLFKKQSNSLDYEYIEQKFSSILEDIRRITSIINHIRIFAREQGNVKFERFDLNEVVNNSQLIVNAQLKSRNINVTIDLCEKPFFILGNKYRLEQVLLNLILNSRYAVEARENSAKDFSYQKKILVKTYNENSHSVLMVEDNGIGIPVQVKAKIFEPFFTTKEPENGTGLGLSIVYGIVKEHGGEITFDSVENEFTKFFIKIPSTD